MHHILHVRSHVDDRGVQLTGEIPVRLFVVRSVSLFVLRSVSLFVLYVHPHEHRDQGYHGY